MKNLCKNKNKTFKISMFDAYIFQSDANCSKCSLCRLRLVLGLICVSYKIRVTRGVFEIRWDVHMSRTKLFWYFRFFICRGWGSLNFVLIIRACKGLTWFPLSTHLRNSPINSSCIHIPWLWLSFFGNLALPTLSWYSSFVFLLLINCLDRN